MRPASKIAFAAVALIVLIAIGGVGAAAPADTSARIPVRPKPIGDVTASGAISGTVGPGTTNKSTVRWTKSQVAVTQINTWTQVLSVSVTKANTGPLVVTASVEGFDEDSVPFMTVTANNVELAPTGGVGLTYDFTGDSFTWALNRAAGTYVIRLLVIDSEDSNVNPNHDDIPDLVVAFRTLHIQYV